MRIWVPRGGIALAVWAGVVAVMAAAGMDPRPVLLAVLTGVLVVVVSVVIDLGPEPAIADWPRSRIVLSPVIDDGRVRQLQRTIEAAGSADVRVATLRRLLAAITDERVRAHHGVDRDTDPEGYRRIVGADLVAWLDVPDGAKVRTSSRELGGILARIEAL